jgi:hypothetical protein
MTRAELKAKKVTELRRIAADLGLPVCRDFTRADLFEMVERRLGLRPNKDGAWKPGDVPAY